MKNFKKEDSKEMSSVLWLDDDWDGYLLEAKMRKRAAKKRAIKRALRKKAMKKLAEAYHYLALLENENPETNPTTDSPKLSDEQIKELHKQRETEAKGALRELVKKFAAEHNLTDDQINATVDRLYDACMKDFIRASISKEDVLKFMKGEGFFKRLWNKVVAGFKFLGKPFTKIAKFVKDQWNKDTHKWWRRIGLIAAALAVVVLLILGRRYIWAFLKFLGGLAKRGFDAVKNFFARIFGGNKSAEEIRNDVINVVSLYDM